MISKRTLFLFSLILAVCTVLAAPIWAQKPSDEPGRAESSYSAGSSRKPAPKPTQPGKPKPAVGVITGLQVERVEDALRIVIKADRVINGRALHLSNPARLIVDLSPAKLSGSVSGSTVGQFGVEKIRVGQRDAKNARVVLDLSAKVVHHLEIQGSEVILWVKPAAELVQQPSIPPIAPEPPAPSELPAEPPQIPTPATQVQISGITLENTATGARLHISVDRLARARSLMLHNPPRLSLDFMGAVLTQGEGTIPGSGEVVSRIRTGQSGSVALIVLDLGGRVSYSINYDDKETTVDLTVLPALPPKRLAGTRIVIDPGHGGHQPGARAYGREEKNLNLAIAGKLNALLNGLGAITSMTRTDDRFVDLYERVAISERFGADLFVSIHCNSCGVKDSVCGTELYYYSEQSRDLALALEKSLVARLGTNDRGVHREGFVVVENSRIPAVLAEIGYINHSVEASKLAKDDFQQKAARAIVEGIASYLGDKTVIPSSPPEPAVNAAPTPEIQKQEEGLNSNENTQ